MRLGIHFKRMKIKPTNKKPLFTHFKLLYKLCSKNHIGNPNSVKSQLRCGHVYAYG